MKAAGMTGLHKHNSRALNYDRSAAHADLLRVCLSFLLRGSLLGLLVVGTEQLPEIRRELSFPSDGEDSACGRDKCWRSSSPGSVTPEPTSV